MFKTLVEAINPEFIRMTDMQKAVLLTVFISDTPAVAYENTSGDIYITYARDFLSRAGLVQLSGPTVSLTPNGYDALISNGLIDETTDEPTERGNDIIEWFNKQKVELNEQKIPFRTIRGCLG